ncbi:hypothetical protein P3T35_000283 [Kitasatospora sp. GP30]|nr:hypothetical protein [Kitasatospora sp. GP30]
MPRARSGPGAARRQERAWRRAGVWRQGRARGWEGLPSQGVRRPATVPPVSRPARAHGRSAERGSPSRTGSVTGQGLTAGSDGSRPIGLRGPFRSAGRRSAASRVGRSGRPAPSVQPSDQTGPARARALAGPTGKRMPPTGALTSTSTLSSARFTVQETSAVRCAVARLAARAQPPSASTSRWPAAASAARSAADSARWRAASTAPRERASPQTASPATTSPTSQMLADPRSRSDPGSAVFSLARSDPVMAQPLPSRCRLADRRLADRLTGCYGHR